MALDHNILLQGRGVQLDNPIDTQNKLAQLYQARNQNRLADMSFVDSQRDRAGENALSQLLGLGKSGEDVTRSLAEQGFGKAGLAYGKQYQDRQKATADIGKVEADTLHTTAQTDEVRSKIVNLAAQQHRDAVGMVNDREAAIGWTQSMYSDPRLKDIVGASGSTVDQAIARIPQDPAGLAEWKMQAALGGQKLIEMTTPDANARLAAKTARQNNADSNNNQIRLQQIKESAAQREVKSEDVEAMAKAIAAGQLAPINGFALARPRGQAIMARVMQLNPTYDGGDYAAKANALRGFSTGKEGTALRSFSVAVDHLETLGHMADALDNGNLQILNKVRNTWKQQTGAAAPTDFKAVKEIVGKEVVKAIIAGGGGVDERKEMSELMADAKSPQQLKGVVTHFLELMGAQRDGLLDQYERTTGRKDGKVVFSPSKKQPPETPAAPALPKGWKVEVH
ncbi:hypothetical protein ACPJXG_10875 [Janthinobacterium sp. NFX145]|uniref:hypothetical protein n=1 Tax=Janthinobacterium sp. NFX145 TaxID=3415602 RepID=UPI003CC64C82